MVAALEWLPGDLRAAVDQPGVLGVHTAKDAYSPKLQFAPRRARPHGHPHRRVGQRAPHAPARVHPSHERQPVLFFNQTYVRDLERPRRPSSVPGLLRRLHQHSTDHRFTVRHRWRNGDLVIWDNRATQHLAVNDYGGHRRELHRTTVEGTVPA